MDLITEILERIKRKFRKTELINEGSFLDPKTTFKEYYKVFGFVFGVKIVKVLIPPFHTNCRHVLRKAEDEK